MTVTTDAWLGARSPIGEILTGPSAPAFTIEVADEFGVRAHRALRHQAFVVEQALFDRDDRDEHDADPRLVTLVARDRSGEVLGGVRLGPATTPDLGWWHGGRLAVSRAGRAAGGVGAALVRAACAHAEAAGALRFDAEVQAGNERFFGRLGWQRVREATRHASPHVLMRYPIGRVGALAAGTKNPLGPLLAGLHLGGPGWVGDDGAPVPGSDLVAACDAIVPSMVERDPEWAGWCGVLVNVNDLAAMGAAPVGLLDAVGGADVGTVGSVLRGLRSAADAYGVPVLGGHTQLGVPAALSVTALGRTEAPVAGAGGRPGAPVRLTADLGGGWRPGYRGRQWDSTTHRSGTELRTMVEAVGGAVGRARPDAAKDVSMTGVVGTLGMLAEASGCGAVLDVAAVPRPVGTTVGDWLTCFPGFAILTAGGGELAAGPAVGGVCGELVPGAGVRLRWPDGEETASIAGPVTGLGAT